jgi:hypothetical protein
VLADDDRDAVLIVIAVTEQAQFRGFDLQGPFPAPIPAGGCYSVPGLIAHGTP